MLLLIYLGTFLINFAVTWLHIFGERIDITGTCHACEKWYFFLFQLGHKETMLWSNAVKLLMSILISLTTFDKFGSTVTCQISVIKC